MPILEVEIVAKPGEILPTGLAAEIADQAATAFQSRPAGTWVRLRTLSPEHYAEGDGGPPTGVFPVFVSVLKAALPEQDQLAAEVAALTRAIADACDRPQENVHILYQLPARGRIAFGGRLL